MNYDDRTVVEYAEERLKAFRSQRKVALPIMGTCVLGLVVCFVWMIHQKSEQVGEWLIGNELFLAGFAFGVLVMVGMLVGAVGLVKMFRLSWGIEGAVYELAARLGRERLR